MLDKHVEFVFPLIVETSENLMLWKYCKIQWVLGTVTVGCVVTGLTTTYPCSKAQIQAGVLLTEPEKEYCFPIRVCSFMRVFSHININHTEGSGHWNRRQRDFSWEEEEEGTKTQEGAWQNAPCSLDCNGLGWFYVSCSAMLQLVS